MRFVILLPVLACTPAPDITCADAPIQAWIDADEDGFGGEDAGMVCEVGSGLATIGQDCDDADDEIHPDADEECDGLDNNCDGQIDEGLARLKVWYTDADGDGFGALFPATQSCGSPGDGWVSVDGDCDDTNAAVHPDATEICNDRVDDDCNGLEDESDPGLDLASQTTFYRDADLDGYGTPTLPTVGCSAPVGTVADGSDCNDSRADVHPGAVEVCSGFDNDCDGLADDADPGIDVATQRPFFVDADQDGYGAPGGSILACSGGPGVVDNEDDCDDTNAELNLDDLDIDGFTTCDGDCDDADPSVQPIDNDGDGFTACDPLADCAPFDGSVFPGAVEIPIDGVDQNCDKVDDCHIDVDLDGFGGTQVVLGQSLACNRPGEADNADDCDDGDPSIIEPQDWYADVDGDGFGAGSSLSFGCTPLVPSHTAILGDCDDADPAIHPDAAEVCDDAIDHDCNGLSNCCDLSLEVEFEGSCYYLDGSGGNCEPGYVLAPQSVLSDIAPRFVGLDYMNVVSTNCCIWHANIDMELQDWGMSQDCNSAGPFREGPLLGGAGCTNANNRNAGQLTFCMTP